MHNRLRLAGGCQLICQLVVTRYPVGVQIKQIMKSSTRGDLRRGMKGQGKDLVSSDCCQKAAQRARSQVR